MMMIIIMIMWLDGQVVRVLGVFKVQARVT